MSERTFHFFQYQHTTLHYSKYGTGAKVMFCFHGFGQDLGSLHILEKSFSDEYTFYSFDLFFHGKSEWGEAENYLTDKFWVDAISSFMKEIEVQKISLLGYSLGARLVWSLAQHMPDIIQEVIVLAPDGIKNSIWFKMSVRTAIGRIIFKYVTKNKYRISSLLTIGKKISLAPKGVIRFAESQLDTEEQRRRVYMTWMVYRKLKVNPKYLAQVLNTYKIPLTIYLGVKDKIISYKKVKRLTEKVNNKKIIYVEAGHSNLINSLSQLVKLNRKTS